MNRVDSKRSSILDANGIGRISNDGQRLLRNVSIRVDPGDRVAVVGPSGSGKTVLLRALILLDPVTEGTVSWHGHPVQKNSIVRFRSRVVYVHQQPQLFEGTVEQNLQMPFALRMHSSRSFDRNRAIELLTSVGRNEAFLTKQQASLSGGEAAIVGLIRAIQLEPEMLLLDEPTAALDEATMLQLENLVDVWFQSSNAHGLVWVSHNESQVSRISNRIIRIENGSLRN